MEEPASLTAYEVERQRKMEENRRRMEEIGLHQMAADMADACGGGEQPPKKKRERKAAAEEAAEPSRRSSRNEGKVISYRFEEERVPGDRKPRDGPLVKDGERPEVYTVAHVLALGTHQKEWEMFTDGYDPESGERIYDPEKGASCHQCRQKTLGQRTSCSRCKSGLGMLCGDCLFARYGEHVEEANEKPDWVCPCCRDLCNCSTHRKKRQWEATGQLHRSVKSRGYLSVAHYLVLNRAGSLAAKRAALATGFCPPDLAAKLKAEIAELEAEREKAAAEGRPLPGEEPEPEPAVPPKATPGEGGEKKKRVRTKKPKAEEGQEGAKEGEGGAAKEGKGLGFRVIGGKKKKKKKAAAGGKGQGGEQPAKKAKKAKAAAGEGSEAAAAGQKKAARRNKKAKPLEAAAEAPSPASPAAAAGVLETSIGSGAVAAEAAEASPAAAAVPAAAIAAVEAAVGKGKGAGKGIKRAGLPGVGTLDEVVAAPARRRRGSAGRS